MDSNDEVKIEGKEGSKIGKFNALVDSYVAAKRADEGGERLKSLENEVFIHAMELFPKSVDALSRFWEIDWRRYDADAAPDGAYAFFGKRLKYRVRDGKNSDREGRWVTEEDEVTHKRSKHKVSGPSLDEQFDREDESEDAPTRRDVLLVTTEGEAYMKFELDESAYDLIVQVMELLNGPTNKSNNETYRSYVRLFFTDSMVGIIHTVGTLQTYKGDPDRVFSAMDVGFLDFFMREECRTVDEIAESPLKLYGDIVAGRPMEETAQPLPGDVYVTYRRDVEGRTCSEALVSQNRQRYYELVRACLC